MIAKLVGENGKVFAFEPEPSNFELLKKNIEINGYHNVVLEQKAVSDKSGDCILYTGQKSSGANRIYEPKKTKTQDFKSIKVSTVSIDDYLAVHNVSRINFIKMDIEGAEFRALQGMKTLLEKNKNLTIFTEFDKLALEDSGINPENFLDFLLSDGFKIYFVDEEQNKIELIDKKKFLNSDRTHLII